MNKILNRFKFWETKEQPYVKPQKFVDLKRTNSIVSFIHPGHPLYDNIAAKEENRLRILAPNETAYSENSLTHNFAAIVIYNGLNYLIINSLKHFKEQSIGGLLQFDENIYNVIPFLKTKKNTKLPATTLSAKRMNMTTPLKVTLSLPNKTEKRQNNA